MKEASTGLIKNSVISCFVCFQAKLIQYTDDT